LAVADRVTVLRHGRVVAERNAGATSEVELAELMLGDSVLRAAEQSPAKSAGKPVLALEAVTLERHGRRVLDGISLTLYAGSIAGIAGVDGNGQNELVELMAGVVPMTSGSIRLYDPAADLAEALTVIPQNRDLDGLILDLSLWENLLLRRALRKPCGARRGWIRPMNAASFCRELLGHFNVLAPGPYAPAASLSGGNRQRLVVARALTSAPRAIVAHDVCRGLDLGAAAELHSRLRAYSAGGGAVLLISSDLDELLALCSRLYVISRGRLHSLPAGRSSPAEIGLLMSGTAQ
jgi:general nucleoside transport system ATP-binding protein